MVPWVTTDGTVLTIANTGLLTTEDGDGTPWTGLLNSYGETWWGDLAGIDTVLGPYYFDESLQSPHFQLEQVDPATTRGYDDPNISIPWDAPGEPD